MTYDQTIEFLYSQLPMFGKAGAGAYKPGLQNAHALAEAFGCPYESFPAIHVAGTNGKGSTSHMLASVLMESGLKVGLYTSPHIFDFGERIRVDGKKIDRDYVVDFVGRYLEKDIDCSPSFFELTTIMAFSYFRDCRVDVAVIETGLGGRLDTTNIITPLLSVITNVSPDHTDLLGDTIEQIAAEKAGIIKTGVPVVVGEACGAEREVFAQKAKLCGADIVFACDTPVRVDNVGGRDMFEARAGMPFVGCELVGEFQIKNVNTVLHAIDMLASACHDWATPKAVNDYCCIKHGLERVCANTGLLGRWTVLQESCPEIICDTGHNIGAWRYIAPMLDDVSRSRKLRVVLGFVSDKDIEPIFDLLPQAAEYYFVSPATKRGRSASDLLNLAENRGLRGKAYESVMDGYRQAIAESGGDGTVFVGGSNYVVAELDALTTLNR